MGEMKNRIDALRARFAWFEGRMPVGRRGGAAAALGLIVALFSYDLLVLEPAQVASHRFDGERGPLWGDITLSQVKVDRDARVMTGDVVIELFSADDFLFGPNVAASLRWVRVNGAERQRFLLEQGQTCTAVLASDYPAAEHSFRSSAVYQCSGIVLADSVDSLDVWYPFDRYSTTLSFTVCANSQEACWPGSVHPVTVESARAQPRRAEHFVASLQANGGGEVVLSLERRPFLRLVTVLIFAISLVFVAYMVLASDPKDTVTKSLSLFGSLWALRSTIMPASVDVFPTIVDGAVLVIFSVVFVLMLVRAADTSKVEEFHEID